MGREGTGSESRCEGRRQAVYPKAPKVRLSLRAVRIPPKGRPAHGGRGACRRIPLQPRRCARGPLRFNHGGFCPGGLVARFRARSPRLAGGGAGGGRLPSARAAFFAECRSFTGQAAALTLSECRRGGWSLSEKMKTAQQFDLGLQFYGRLPVSLCAIPQYPPCKQTQLLRKPQGRQRR